MITAMTAILFFLIIGLLVAAWAPARLRALRTGTTHGFDSHEDRPSPVAPLRLM
jgi:hypothetical protein